MATIAQLENKYGVHITVDFQDGNHTYYKMFSADGCPWENGLTFRGLCKECKTWEDALIQIKNAN